MHLATNDHRATVLTALRSGEYEKGLTPPTSGGVGRGSGHCVCAVFRDVLGEDWLTLLGIEWGDCSAIIKANEGPQSFLEIAGALEGADFRLPDRAGCPNHSVYDSSCDACRAAASHRPIPPDHQRRRGYAR